MISLVKTSIRVNDRSKRTAGPWGVAVNRLVKVSDDCFIEDGDLNAAFARDRQCAWRSLKETEKDHIEEEGRRNLTNAADSFKH